MESMEDFEAMLNASLRRINNGDVVNGRVLAVQPDYLLLDVGSYMDGILPREELAEGESTADFAVGDKLTLTVKHVDTREGQITLSKKEAEKVIVWSDLQAKQENGEPITVKVKKAVNGGLRVSYRGLADGFVPASQAADRFTEDLAPFENTELSCLILEVNPEKKEFTASRRRLLDLEKKAARDRIFAELKPGMKVTGKVVRLADYGAFVEIEPGVDGLVHLSDLSWTRIKHPSELLSEGDIVTVTVREVDSERGRISLQLKDINADPWENMNLAVGEYREGCRVNKLIDTGAFLTVAPGVEGFLPISQASDKKLKSMEEVVHEGDFVTVRILKIDREARKLSLSMREVSQEPEELSEASSYTADENAVTALGGLFKDLM